jgi:erythromycin esterase-like protein
MQAKITQYRIDVFKQLVKKCNYTVFVLEENYYNCEIINKYIQGKSNIDIKNFIIKEFMFPWKNIHILNLIKWMRKYNNKNESKLEFIGIDCQKINNKIKTKCIVIKYIDKIIKEHNVNKKDRDLCMYNIFMKIYKPEKKYFLYAHMGHLQKNQKYTNNNKILWLGMHLYKKFKNKYFVFGNTFYYGTYLGLEFNENNDCYFTTNTITKNMTKKSYKFKKGLNIINNNNKNLDIYEGHAVVETSEPMKYFYKSKVKNKYNAIIVINDEMPYKVLK